MTERIVKAKGIDICTETFGDPGDVPLLLVMGAGASMLIWEEGFCRRLAAGGRFVIRYDNRDVGTSTHIDFESNPYTAYDMADDAVSVLDAYDVKTAHIAGMSLGGIITQCLAIAHRDRVRTITTIMSTPTGNETSAAAFDRELPEGGLSLPTPEVIEATMGYTNVDWTDREAVIAARQAVFSTLAGSRYPYDAARMGAIFAAEFDRDPDISHSNNHGMAVAITPVRTDELPKLDVPCLVVHGDDDPILPYDHGQAIADGVPGATMLTLEGVGHELPEPIWDHVVAAILDHTSQAN